MSAADSGVTVGDKRGTKHDGKGPICMRGSMEEESIYGTERMAAHLGVSKQTLKRWRHLPEGQFIEVGSMANAGGGFGRGAWSFPSSLDALKHTMATKTSAERRRTSLLRWRGSDPGSGSTLARSGSTAPQNSGRDCDPGA